MMQTVWGRGRDVGTHMGRMEEVEERE